MASAKGERGARLLRERKSEKIFDTLLRKCLTFSLCKFLPKIQRFSKTCQMNFLKGGEYPDTSTRHTYTSGKNPSPTKDVLLDQNKGSLFDQYYFSKLLVAPTFEFAKTLVSKVVEF